MYKHLNKQNRPTIKKTLDETIGVLIEMESRFVPFTRNLFDRPSSGEPPKPRSFNGSESRFLYILFDSLHNVPELLRNLVNVKNASDKVNPGLVWAVLKGLAVMSNLFNGKSLRRIMKIRDTKNISLWLGFWKHWQLSDCVRKLEENFRILCPQLWPDLESEEASK
ncbi:MAG: hypothetical protein IKN82_08305 [Treponema sp.]|nr:hypothetical protein [Treponema sp.]